MKCFPHIRAFGWTWPWTACCALALCLLAACGGGQDDSEDAHAAATVTQAGGSGPPPSAAQLPAADPAATQRQPGTLGYVLTSALWGSGAAIPVCWVNPSPADQTERLWVQQAIQRTWELSSRVTFTGWDTCPALNQFNAIRISISDTWPLVLALGRDLRYYDEGMHLNFTFAEWGQSCQSSSIFRRQCIESIAAHEFGHALGFAHEQNRPDTPSAQCADAPQGQNGDVTVGAWDLHSIMNYCNPSYNNYGALSPTDILTVQTYYGSPRGTGLSAFYFNNATLQGDPVLVRKEAVNFNWGYGNPAPNLPADNFSVRWSGQIEAPLNGTYQLQTLSDDGVRVWVDGQLLIDNWTGHAATANTSQPLRWDAGQRHAIVMEYQELGGASVAQLLWQTPGSSGFVPVPIERLSPAASGTGLSGAYFGTPNLQGPPALIRTENIDAQWAGAPPGVNVPVDGFSVRWSGLVEAPSSGPYELMTLSDDGVRVWVDGQLVINNWTSHVPLYDVSPVLNWGVGQQHVITMEYQELGGPGTALLAWRVPGTTSFATVPAHRLYPAPTGRGLQGRYFPNANLQGPSVLTRTEGINFQWPGAPAGVNVPADGFSVGWRGLIEAPETGSHVLQTLSDDGVRVWLDGQLVINNWTGHAPVYNTAAPQAWVAGERHAIVVEYQEIGGPGTAQLLWRTPRALDFGVVPAERLYLSP